MTLGAAGLFTSAGTSSLSPTVFPIQEEAAGGPRVAGPNKRIPGQKRMEAEERCCDPAAGPHQGHAGKKNSQEDENRCKFDLKHLLCNKI